MLTPEQIVERARRALGRMTVYRLGKGVLIPQADKGIDGKAPLLPIGKDGDCDCSGFACWALALPRHDRMAERPLFDKWWGTDNIVADALVKNVRFKVLTVPIVGSLAGALVVYPGHSKDGVWRYGHVGVLTGPTSVIHCSGGNYKRTGDAIQETGLEVFAANPKTIYAGLIG